MSNAINRPHVSGRNDPQTFTTPGTKPVTLPAPAYLRDEIAMAALTGILSNPGTHLPGVNKQWMCDESYDFADAMLAARDAT